MDADRFRQVERAVLDALELDANPRQQFISHLRARDPALAVDVERLIRLDEESGGSLRTWVNEGADPTLDPLVGHWLGDYRIDRLIGVGGMGRVYEAHQREPQRRVALKVIASRFLPAVLVRRFRQEARFLASLEHPGICRVFEAGRRTVGPDSIPYISMEFVDGERLDTAAAGLSLRDRIRCMALVCDAVGHAHASGVLHRDLKPGNVLVCRQRDALGHPVCKVLDFGVARSIRDDAATAGLTLTGQPIGTPRYMSPEQAAGRPADARSDVYSLGVMMRDTLAGEEHARLASLPAELRIIIAAATDDDPRRRYSTARELSSDLFRFLDDRPILARKSTVLYRASKFVRRHRVGVIAGVALLAAIAAVLGAVLSYADAHRSRSVVRSLAQRSDYLSRIQEAEAAVKADDPALARDRLDAIPAALRGWEWHYLDRSVDRSIQAWQLPETLADAAPTGVAFDGASFVVSFDDVCVRVSRGVDAVAVVPMADCSNLAWDTSLAQAATSTLQARVSDRGLEVSPIDPATTVPSFVEFNRHVMRSITVAPGSPERLVAATAAQLMVWDTATGERLSVLRGHNAVIRAVACGPDGLVWSVADDGTIRCWEAPLIGDFERTSGAGFIAWLPFTSFARHDASTKVLEPLDPRTLAPIRAISDIPARPYRFHLTRDKRWLVLAGTEPDSSARVVDIADGTMLAVKAGFRDEDRYFAVDEARARLVMGGRSGRLRVFSLPDLAEIQSFDTGREIHEGAMSPAGDLAVAVHSGATTAVYSLTDGTRVCEVETRGMVPLYPCFSDDGQLIAALNNRELNLNLWDARTGRLLRRVQIPEHPMALVRLPGHNRLAVGTNDGILQIYPFEQAPAANGAVSTAPWTPALSLRCRQEALNMLMAAPDGRTLAAYSNSLSPSGFLTIWRIGEP